MDVASGMGFCAEHSAVAALLTVGEYTVKRMVAVCKDEAGALFVLVPCGPCRELLRQIQGGALETEVILGANEVVALSELLPHPGRFQRVEGS